MGDSGWVDVTGGSCAVQSVELSSHTSRRAAEPLLGRPRGYHRSRAHRGLTTQSCSGEQASKRVIELASVRQVSELASVRQVSEWVGRSVGRSVGERAQLQQLSMISHSTATSQPQLQSQQYARWQ